MLSIYDIGVSSVITWESNILHSLDVLIVIK